MSVVSVYLMGGLGNQMFQYAFARALSIDFSKRLLLDTKTGFNRDHQFKRQFELDPFPIVGYPAGPLQRSPFWTYHLQKKLKLTSQGVLNNGLIWQHVIEKKNQFSPEVFKIAEKKNQWIFGYWQSPLYFEKHKSTVLSELTPPIAKDSKYIKIAEEVRDTNAVAVCIRQYEESPDPGLQSRDKKIKAASDINKVLDEFRTLFPGSRFYVFSTVRSNFLDQLNLPADSKFILGQDGYSGTLETLWLLTHFKHHVITNSSFYWWGAWLSQKNYDISEQTIYAADNFLNMDSICSNWKVF